MRIHQKYRADRERNLIANRVVHQRAAATVGNVIELHPQLIPELDHREVTQAARSDRAV